MAMTLRTGKGGRYRYYTCSTKARQGETRCRGRIVPMEKLDTLVAGHIEHRLLQPSRLEKILSSVLGRREERAGRQATHIAELRKRASEADAKLKRLYDAIENGVTDLSDLMLKDRITELKAIRDQARADTERAEGAINRQGPTITTQSIKAFARTARKRMRIEGGGYRRDYLRALAQRVEVDAQELRIMGVEKRTAAHPRRRFKRKNGGFWRFQWRRACAEDAFRSHDAQFFLIDFDALGERAEVIAAVTTVARRPGKRLERFRCDRRSGAFNRILGSLRVKAGMVARGLQFTDPVLQHGVGQIGDAILDW
jgi:hypothetical protein